MHMQAYGSDTTQCNTPLTPRGMSHYQDPPRETPKAVVTNGFLKHST